MSCVRRYCIMAFNFDELKRKTGDLAQKGADWAQLGMNKAEIGRASCRERG